jgi:hypothetical protein
MKKFPFHLFFLLYLLIGIRISSASESSDASLSAENDKDADKLFDKVILVQLKCLDGHIGSLNSQDPMDIHFDQLAQYLWDLWHLHFGYTLLLNCSFDSDRLNMIKDKFDYFKSEFIELVSKLGDHNLKGLLEFTCSHGDLSFATHLFSAANKIDLFQQKYSRHNLFINSFLLILNIINQQIGKNDNWLDRVECLQILKDFLQRVLETQFPEKQKNSFSTIFKDYLFELRKAIRGFRNDLALNDNSAIEKRRENYVEILFHFQDKISKESQTESFDLSTKDVPDYSPRFKPVNSILIRDELKRDVSAMESHLFTLCEIGISELRFIQISTFLNDSYTLFNKACSLDIDAVKGISFKEMIIDLILRFQKKLVIPFYKRYQPHFLVCLSEIKDMNLTKFFIALLCLNANSNFENLSDARACIEVFWLIVDICKSQIDTLVQWRHPVVCFESLIKILKRFDESNSELILDGRKIHLKNFITVLSQAINQIDLVEKDKFNFCVLPDRLKESMINPSPPKPPHSKQAISDSPADLFEIDFQEMKSHLMFLEKTGSFALKFSDVADFWCKILKLFGKVNSADKATKKSMLGKIGANLLMFCNSILIPFYEKDQCDFMSNLSENNDPEMIKFVIVLLNLKSDKFDFSDLSNRQVYNNTIRLLNNICKKKINTEAELKQTVRGLTAFLKIFPKLYNSDLNFHFLNLQIERSITILSEMIKPDWIKFDENQGLFNGSILKSSLLSIISNPKGLDDSSNDVHVATIIFLLNQYYLKIDIEAARPIFLKHIIRLNYMSPFGIEKEAFYSSLGDSNTVFLGLNSLLESVKSSHFIKSSLNRDKWLAKAREITSSW